MRTIILGHGPSLWDKSTLKPLHNFTEMRFDSLKLGHPWLGTLVHADRAEPVIVELMFDAPCKVDENVDMTLDDHTIETCKEKFRGSRGDEQC